MRLGVAKTLVDEYLRELETSIGEELCLLADDTIESSCGWVFFFNSKEFVRTRSLKHTLVGNGPLFVDKNTGAVVQFGTAYPVDDYIDYYEKTGSVLS